MASAVMLAAGAGALSLATYQARKRLLLSRAKHPSLAGHAQLRALGGVAYAVL